MGPSKEEDEECHKTLGTSRMLNGAVEGGGRGVPQDPGHQPSKEEDEECHKTLGTSGMLNGAVTL